MDYKKIVEILSQFNKDRDWEQFHNLKDLSAAIAIETSELQEHFLWVKNNEIESVLSKKRVEIEDEFADIFCYMILFAQKANIDIENAVLDKIKKSSEKYPVEKAKGKADKYTELQ